jgi:hypothetical protein
LIGGKKRCCGLVTRHFFAVPVGADRFVICDVE